MIRQGESKGKKRLTNLEKVQIEKLDHLRDPNSNKIKSLRALIQIENQMIQLTLDTGSPISFLNWATLKDTIEKSKRARFLPAENLSLAAPFEDYIKEPILILGTLITDLRSTGW